MDIVKNGTYVGLADEVFALLQHNTHLYLMNVVSVRYELNCYIFLFFLIQFSSTFLWKYVNITAKNYVWTMQHMSLLNQKGAGIGDACML